MGGMGKLVARLLERDRCSSKGRNVEAFRAVAVVILFATDEVDGGSVSGVVGFVPGFFDLFHVGDLDLLRQAREHCDRLIVGVVADELRECYVPFPERAEILRHVRHVDEVTALDSWDLAQAHARLGFQVVVVPYGQLVDLAEDLGVRVVTLTGLRETASAKVLAALSLTGTAA
jgi:glycerol-3-phosphate cytidylyltransferase